MKHFKKKKMDIELQFKTCEHLFVHGLVLAKFPKLKQYAIAM